MNIQDQLEKANIVPDPLKDQFFLTDENIIKKTIEFADLRKDDIVLEIGAGVGNLTSELANKVKKVFAFEIDERFKPFLSKLSTNVEVHYENAWQFVQMHGKFRKKKIYNKVVSNLPYSFIEPFLHNLTFLDYDKVILLVPSRFMKKTEKWGVVGSFFKPTVLLEVPKESFYPTPKTNSVLIDLVKLPDPLEHKNLGRFLRQCMYQHEDQLVKNSLMEGLIKYQKLIYSKSLTKNEARAIILKIDIDQRLLNIHPNNSQIYEVVEKKFNDILSNDEENYITKIPNDKIINIYPFDNQIIEIVDKVITLINKAFPDLETIHMGASALEISGQNDIDIYAFSDPKDFSKYLSGLIKIFGKPLHVHETFIEWGFTKNGFDIEFYLTSKDSETIKKQIEVFKILRNDKNLLKGYEELKEGMNGKSFKEYQRKKYEFYHKILNK